MRDIEHDDDRSWPAGRWISVIVLVTLAFLLVALIVVGMPAFERARAEARHAAAISRLHQLGAAVEAYAAGNEGRLPPPEGWVRALRTYISDIDEVVRSPRDPEAGRIYAMNRWLDGKRLVDVRLPATTVMFFEVEAGSPESGGPELLRMGARELNTYSVVFVDGNLRSVPLTEISRLIWEP